ncbi:MAG TPA: monovalent cation/H(+) antiporter subunit G, partial [Chthoniobacterales bacterium]
MTTSDWICAILLGLAVLFTALSVLGLLVMRNVFDRLHAIAPANLLPPVFVGAALAIANGLSASSLKVVLVVLVLVGTSPVLTHAIARAARVRKEGRLE